MQSDVIERVLSIVSSVRPKGIDIDF